MQFKKSKAILAAVLTAAMASSAIMTCTASAQDGYRAGKRTKEEKYGTATYAQRFLSLYDDVITNGVENGYLSKNNIPSGGFGVPYHSIEEVICEAPDYGHETTSEAMSYLVWVAAMRDNIAKFINNAATQIAGESSNDGMNEYGFYFDKTYWSEEMGFGYAFHEDGSVDIIDGEGNVLATSPPEQFSYSNGVISELGVPIYSISDGGKTITSDSGTMTLK